MKLDVELTEEDLKKLVIRHLEKILNCELSIDDVKIEVKSKQNYKSEWEVAAFRARVVKQS
jgi:predicted component of type VI protein secretion system